MTTLLWVLAVAAMALGPPRRRPAAAARHAAAVRRHAAAARLDGFAHAGPGLPALLGALAVAAWLIDYVAATWRVPAPPSQGTGTDDRERHRALA